eukprot:2658595-Pyramimonas_sp.AAC.1
MGPRSAVLANTCGHSHWGLWWRPLSGHEALCWGGETHADTATGASVGPLIGPPSVVLGGGEAHANHATGAF